MTEKNKTTLGQMFVEAQKSDVDRRKKYFRDTLEKKVMKEDEATAFGAAVGVVAAGLGKSKSKISVGSGPDTRSMTVVVDIRGKNYTLEMRTTDRIQVLLTVCLLNLNDPSIDETLRAFDFTMTDAAGEVVWPRTGLQQLADTQNAYKNAKQED